MVCVFDKNATSFEGNGKCVLSPTVCTVHEVGGGTYELYMEHPMDDTGKWLMIGDDSLIKAPVPPTHVPQIKLPNVKIWKTTVSTSLYSKLPVLAKKEQKKETKDTFATIKANPSSYTWSSARWYNSGAYVVNGEWVFKAQKANINVNPRQDSTIWSPIVKLSSISPSGSTAGESTYKPGEVAETLAANETVYKIADYNETYIRVRSIRGTVGYVAKSDCTETTTEQSGEVIPAQDITEQVFRVYSVECDEETQVVTVEAKHISYDFQANSLYDCKFTDVNPNTALSCLIGALMLDDNRRIACNVTGKKLTKDWSFKNPINALLDPDEGLVPELGARLIRNNGDFFILTSNNPAGITISYGVNMQGVRWTRSTENVITRIIPRCNDTDGGYLYLTDLFVDSDLISEYPFPRIYVMDTGYKVDEEYEQADGTKVKRTVASCRSQMRTDAREKFTKDHVDGVEITLEVDFLLLGDTVEYKQYKGLQKVNLYDKVKVITGKSNIESEAVVTEYEWDCIGGRYNTVTLGTISSFSRRVPGYRVTNQSITYSKLSPDLINRIISSNDSSTTDAGSSGGSESGGAYDIPTAEIIDNLTSTRTDAALSANQGRVLNNRAVQVINEPGTYQFNCICAGYITGSGNYIDFTVPVSIRPGLRATSATLTNGSSLFRVSGTINVTGRPCAVQSNYAPDNLVKIETALSSTDSSPNTPVSVLFVGTITFA